MTTALHVITGALRTIGVLAEGETATADQATDALVLLNYQLEMFSLEGSAVYAIQQDLYALTSQQNSYTYGPGGDWDAPRPTYIDRLVYLSTSNQVEYPLTMITQRQWQNISVKSVGSNIPYFWWDDGDWPLRRVYLWPTPTAGNQMRVYTWKILDTIASVDTDLSFPQGYELLMRYYLAKRLAPEYEQPWSALQENLLREVSASVRRNNDRPEVAEVDTAWWPRTRYNVYSDTSRGRW